MPDLQLLKQQFVRMLSLSPVFIEVMLNKLIEEGVDLWQEKFIFYKTGWQVIEKPLLQIVCENNYTKVLEILLKICPADKKSGFLQGTKDYSPLHALAENSGREEINKMLLENGANPNYLFQEKTPLYCAIRCDIPSSKVFELLIKNGADINAQVQGHSLLYWACYYASYTALENLLKAGARLAPNEKNVLWLIADAADARYRYHSGVPKVIKMLFKQDALSMNKFLAGEGNEWTPFHLICQTCNQEAIEALCLTADYAVLEKLLKENRFHAEWKQFHTIESLAYKLGIYPLLAQAMEYAKQQNDILVQLQAVKLESSPNLEKYQAILGQIETYRLKGNPHTQAITLKVLEALIKAYLKDKNINEVLCLLTPIRNQLPDLSHEVAKFLKENNPINVLDANNQVISSEVKLQLIADLEKANANPYYPDTLHLGLKTFYEGLTLKSQIFHNMISSKAGCIQAKIALILYYQIDLNQPQQAQQYLPVGANPLHLIAYQGTLDDLRKYCSHIDSRTLFIQSKQKFNMKETKFNGIPIDFIPETLNGNWQNPMKKEYKRVLARELCIFNLHVYFVNYGIKSFPGFKQRLKQFANLLKCLNEGDIVNANLVIKDIWDQLNKASGFVMNDTEFAQLCDDLINKICIQSSKEFVINKAREYLKFIKQNLSNNTLSSSEKAVSNELNIYLKDITVVEEVLPVVNYNKRVDYNYFPEENSLLTSQTDKEKLKADFINILENDPIWLLDAIQVMEKAGINIWTEEFKNPFYHKKNILLEIVWDYHVNHYNKWDKKLEILLEHCPHQFKQAFVEGNENFSLLHKACSTPQVNIVNLLLKHDADPNKKYKGNFALHSLLNTDSPSYSHSINEIISSLIKHNADVNSKDRYGLTPLFYARNAAHMKLLLENGADPSVEVKVQIDDRVGKKNILTKICCSSYPYIFQEIIQFLFEKHAANMNKLMLKNYKTHPLFYLICSKDSNERDTVLEELLFSVDRETLLQLRSRKHTVVIKKYTLDEYAKLKKTHFKLQMAFRIADEKQEILDTLKERRELKTDDDLAFLPDDSRKENNSKYERYETLLDKIETYRVNGNRYITRIRRDVIKAYINEALLNEDFSKVAQLIVPVIHWGGFDEQRIQLAEALLTNPLTGLGEEDKKQFIFELIDKLPSNKMVPALKNIKKEFDALEKKKSQSYQNWFIDIRQQASLNQWHRELKAKDNHAIISLFSYYWSKGEYNEANKQLPADHNILHCIAKYGRIDELIYISQKTPGRELLRWRHQTITMFNRVTAEQIARSEIAADFKSILDKRLSIFNIHYYFCQYGSSSLPGYERRLTQFAKLLTTLQQCQKVNDNNDSSSSELSGVKTALKGIIKEIKKDLKNNFLINDNTFYNFCNKLIDLFESDSKVVLDNIIEYINFLEHPDQKSELTDQKVINELKTKLSLGNDINEEEIEMKSFSPSLVNSSDE